MRFVPYVIERSGTSPDGVQMASSGPWPVTKWGRATLKMGDEPQFVEKVSDDLMCPIICCYKNRSKQTVATNSVVSV